MESKSGIGIEPDETLSPPLIKWGWLRALLFVAAFVILSIVVGVLGSVFLSGSGFAGLPDLNSPLLTLLEGVSVASVFLLIILFRLVLDRRSVTSLGFSFKPQFRTDFLSGILFGIGLQLAIFGILWITGQIQVVGVSFMPGSLLIVLLTLIFAAVQEEIAMRGYMLNNIMESANKYLSLVLVSLLFAILHGFNPDVSLAGLLNIILAGLLLGVYYIHRKNLWFPIGLHIAWNYFEGPVLGSPVSGVKLHSILQLKFVGSSTWTGGHFGFEASLLTAMLTAVAILLVHFLYRTRADNTRSQGAGNVHEKPQSPP